MNKDLNMGKSNENKVLTFLNGFCCKDPLIKRTNKRAVIDFYNSCSEAELKSRRVKHNQYKDTMVGLNKILKAEKDTSKKLYRFYFLFTDGLYYWDYNKEQYTIRKGGRWDRGRPEIKEYAYVDVNDLILLTAELSSKVVSV